MIRTLIFGAIAGLVGKKLYDSGKLDEFKDDLKTRLNIQGDRTDTPDRGPRTAPSPTSHVPGSH